MSAAPIILPSTIMPQEPIKSENQQPSQPVMEKKDRKKLKKLRKRLSQVQTEGEQSGLLTSSEWVEYQLLMENPSASSNACETVGPSVHIRKKKERIRVEGTHHRDLLAWFLHRMKHPSSSSSSGTNTDGKTSKKRPRNEIEKDPFKNPSIPSWASIHNPGTFSRIAVVEIQVSNDDITNYSAMIQSQLEAQSRKHVVLPTKWFQGRIPRFISESLMYFVANKNKNKMAKTDPQVPPPIDELFKQLEELTLPTEDWEKENYPNMCQNHKGSDSNEKSETKASDVILPDLDNIQDPNTIPLEDAKTLVEKAGFRVERQKEDDKQLYISTEPVNMGVMTVRPTRVLGLDCEMVLTDLGSELARITLVQFEGFQEDALKSKTVLDILVKPENPVKDYLTRHSGVTAKLLDPVTIRLAQVQVALRKFLRPNDILVGHSLENDLHATHYIHPKVIDTALVFRPHHKRTKFSLRHLAAVLLRKTIQNGSHCSEQDAETALELAARRAWLGDSFGVPGGDERRSLFEGVTSETTAVCIGPPSWLQNHITNHANGIHALGYESIVDCKKAMLAWLKGKRRADLIWTHLAIDGKKKGTNTLESLKDLISEVATQMPPTTILLVALQQGCEQAKEVNKRKLACRDPRSSVGWSIENEEAWHHAVDLARSGIAYWIGASPSRANANANASML